MGVSPRRRGKRVRRHQKGQEGKERSWPRPAISIVGCRCRQNKGGRACDGIRKNGGGVMGKGDSGGQMSRRGDTRKEEQGAGDQAQRGARRPSGRLREGKSKPASSFQDATVTRCHRCRQWAHDQPCAALLAPCTQAHQPTSEWHNTAAHLPFCAAFQPSGPHTWVVSLTGRPIRRQGVCLLRC